MRFVRGVCDAVVLLGVLGFLWLVIQWTRFKWLMGWF